jgi:hypothetical protein
MGDGWDEKKSICGRKNRRWGDNLKKKFKKNKGGIAY